MRESLGMRYRKVVQLAVHANSAKSLILRQQWAIRMLKLWQKRKNILTIDETWLNFSDMRRRKWQVPGTSNGV